MKAYELKLTPIDAWVRDALASPNQQWLIKDLVPAGGFTLIAGRPKLARKSWLAQLIALSVATGKRTGPLEPMSGPLPVIYIDLEVVEKPTAQRYSALAKGYGLELPDNLFIAPNAPFHMTSPECVAELRRLAAETGARLVIIDTMAKAIGGVDENSSRDMGMALLCAAALKQDGVASIVVHHLGKAAKLQPGEHMDPDSGLRGSSAISGAYDQILSIQQATVEGERNSYLIVGGKFAAFTAATIDWALTNVRVGSENVLDTATVTIGEFGELPVQDEVQSTSRDAKFPKKI